jgi:hypothetical protein
VRGDVEPCVGALEVAPYAVDRLRKSGYELVGLDTCIGGFDLVSFALEVLMSFGQESKLGVLMSESSFTRGASRADLVCTGMLGNPKRGAGAVKSDNWRGA